MTLSSNWVPQRPLCLSEVLSTGSVGGVCVGDPIDRIEVALGPPAWPAARLARRSRLWLISWGNVTFTTEERRIIHIAIDFEQITTAQVTAGNMAGWQLSEWRRYATTRQLAESRSGDVYRFDGWGMVIETDDRGRLHLVTLTDRPRTPPGHPTAVRSRTE